MLTFRVALTVLVWVYCVEGWVRLVLEWIGCFLIVFLLFGEDGFGCLLSVFEGTVVLRWEFSCKLGAFWLSCVKFLAFTSVIVEVVLLRCSLGLWSVVEGIEVWRGPLWVWLFGWSSASAIVGHHWCSLWSYWEILWRRAFFEVVALHWKKQKKQEKGRKGVYGFAISLECCLRHCERERYVRYLREVWGLVRSSVQLLVYRTCCILILAELRIFPLSPIWW